MAEDLDADLTTVLTQIRLRSLNESQLRTLSFEIEKLRGVFAIYYITTDILRNYIERWAKHFGGIWSYNGCMYAARDLNKGDRARNSDHTHYTQTQLRALLAWDDATWNQKVFDFSCNRRIEPEEDDETTALSFLEFVL